MFEQIKEAQKTAEKLARVAGVLSKLREADKDGNGMKDLEQLQDNVATALRHADSIKRLVEASIELIKANANDLDDALGLNLIAELEGSPDAPTVA